MSYPATATGAVSLSPTYSLSRDFAASGTACVCISSGQSALPGQHARGHLGLDLSDICRAVCPRVVVRRATARSNALARPAQR